MSQNAIEEGVGRTDVARRTQLRASLGTPSRQRYAPHRRSSKSRSDGCLGPALADRLFDLAEPWRGRFIALVADRADGGLVRDRPHGRQPGPDPQVAARAASKAQVALWLSDAHLAHLVGHMLRAWTGDT